jgi:hypothetical protein
MRLATFYTCATLLKEPTRSKLQAVIRGYAEERLRLARLPVNRLNLDSALDEFERTHDQMTILVDQGLSAGTPIAVPLTQYSKCGDQQSSGEVGSDSRLSSQQHRRTFISISSRHHYVNWAKPWVLRKLGRG